MTPEQAVLDHISKKTFEIAKDDANRFSDGERIIARFVSMLADQQIATNKRVDELDQHIADALNLIAPLLAPLAKQIEPQGEAAVLPELPPDMVTPPVESAPPMPPLPPIKAKKHKGNGVLVPEPTVLVEVPADVKPEGAA